MRFTDGSVLGTYTTTTSSGVTSGRWNANDIYNASLNKLWPHVPVFTNTTGVTAYTDTLTNLNYQTSINYTPTSYGAAGLPTGVSITSAGLITGTAASSGLYVTTLSAINLNGAGYSTFTINVSAGAIQYLTATGGTTTTGNGYSQWAFTSSGTWTVTTPGIAYYAIVAGGGGGGGYGGGGGGAGAGGVVTGILSASAGTYSVIIGAGGTGNTGTSTYPTNGSISSLAGLSAVGGGAGAYVVGGAWVAPLAGGSGGGTGTSVTGSINIGGIGVAGQGWQGGYDINTGSPYPGGAGGGAGGVGGSGSGSQSGAGGPGLSIYLPASGVSTYVGGGGGGGGTYQGAAAGTGGTGGGGTGGTAPGGNATSGATNTGGGGGGGSNNSSSPQGTGGAGGSGIVYIWSPIATPAKTPYVQYLAVAGGGGGGVWVAGGGGAGGLLTGTTTVSAGVTYTVQVGAGGTASAAGSYPIYGNGGNGGNSGLSATNFTNITAVGGGGGMAATTGPAGVAGGSGGGGAGGTEPSGGAGTTGQGYTGGSSNSGSPNNLAGGGGGFGMIGANGASSLGTGTGNGGDGGTFGIANGTGLNWSNYLKSTTDYLQVPWNSAFDFGTGDWTIEGWWYITQFNAQSTQNNFISNGDGAANDGSKCGWWLRYDSGGTLSIFQYTSGAIQYSYTITLNTNQWYHIACTKASNVIRMFVNGVQQGSNQSDTNSWSSPATSQPININSIKVGGGGSYYINMSGYFSNIRVVKGTGVYTSNFTSPTNALTAITNTTLLTCQSPAFIDNSSNNFTLTKSGSPYIASQNPFGVSYAGGGGGAFGTGGVNAGKGGMGGGGKGGDSSTLNGVAGTTNTGGGGGGGGVNYPSGGAGGTGGSGIVVLSYPSSYPVAASTTGSPSLTAINGNNIYKFTATGSITF